MVVDQGEVAAMTEIDDLVVQKQGNQCLTESIETKTASRDRSQFGLQSRKTISRTPKRISRSKKFFVDVELNCEKTKNELAEYCLVSGG